MGPDELEKLLLRRPPGVAGGRGQPSRGVEEHQGPTSLRTAPSEEQGERAALGETENGGLLRPGGIHDCADVIGLRLEVGQASCTSPSLGPSYLRRPTVIE